MVDLVIKNGKIVSPRGIISAGIAVDKGKIVAIATEDNLPPAAQTIDATAKYILPGLIDPHVHLGYSAGKLQPVEKGTLAIFVQDHFEEVFAREAKTETMAMAAGGVTTIGIFQRFVEKGTLAIFDEYKGLFEQNAICDGFLHHKVLFEAGMNDIPKCPEIGVNSFKFLPGYKGKRAAAYGTPPTDDGWLFLGFEKVSQLGRPVRAMVHAENADIMLVLGERLEKSGRTDVAAWRDTRPNFVEAECITRCINIAKAVGCPLYIVHMTAGEGVDILAKAKAEGLDVKGEVCAQNLTHTSDEPVPLIRDNPTLGIMNPPLRDKASIDKLWQGISTGVIDTLASDTVVETREEKGDDIWTAPPGLGNNGEMILPVMLSEGVNKGKISLEKVAEVCSYNAAKIFGIFPQKGIIAVGSDADLVIVDLDKKVKVTPQMLHSACDWTIYDGWDFTGWPVLTILRGQVVAQEGKIIAEPGIGKFLFCKVE